MHRITAISKTGGKSSSYISSQKNIKLQTRRYTTGIPTEATVATYKTFGAPETVVKLEKQKLPTAGATDVVVKMLAAPINPADLNMIEGNYGVKATLPAVGGNEGVGVVVHAGKGVKGLKEGDKVIPSRAGLGTWRTYGVFSESDLQTVPDDIPVEYLATISVNPCTALRLLEDFVSLKPGDVIVQNGANSMVGTALMQIAAARDIKTINIIRSRPGFPETVERLKSLGGYIVVSDEYITTPQFRRVISDLPKPKLALNCVGGESATEMGRILDNNGTLVTYGGMSRKPVTLPTSLFIFKNIASKGFWLTKWVEEHSKEERAKMLNPLFDLIRKRKLKLWMENWGFSKFDEALKQTKEQYRDRKVVLTLDK